MYLVYSMYVHYISTVMYFQSTKLPKLSDLTCYNKRQRQSRHMMIIIKKFRPNTLIKNLHLLHLLKMG